MSSSKVSVAAIQMAVNPTDRQENIKNLEKLIRKAASEGANIICGQELFQTIYFCQKQREHYNEESRTIEEDPAVNHFQKVAKELDVVIIVSFFEKYKTARFNSVVVIDATGEILEVYRKSHIPDGPGYSEKFYFHPGDTGFKCWKTKYATIGVGICWDQWFPEAARIMALKGAELLFYPTAIGSEPLDPSYDSKAHWQTCMQGHAAANLIPVIASNRIGTESIEDSKITFYGSSFITDHCGQIVAEANRTDETVLVKTFDLKEIEKLRISWGTFRDRRPDLYYPLLTRDGSEKKS